MCVHTLQGDFAIRLSCHCMTKRTSLVSTISLIVMSISSREGDRSSCKLMGTRGSEKPLSDSTTASAFCASYGLSGGDVKAMPVRSCGHAAPRVRSGGED